MPDTKKGKKKYPELIGYENDMIKRLIRLSKASDFFHRNSKRINEIVFKDYDSELPNIKDKDDVKNS